MMRNTKENSDDSANITKGEMMIIEAVDEFVSKRELIADSIDDYDEMFIPVTMRLNKYKVAELDHLVKRWRTTRAALASDLLEEIIPLVLQRVYLDKTKEEYVQLQSEILKEFEKKKKATKRKKGTD